MLKALTRLPSNLVLNGLVFLLALYKYPMFSVGHLGNLGRSLHHNNPLITPSELSSLYRNIFTDSGNYISEEMKGLI